YRTFVVRGAEGYDDLAAMREVLTRRFRRAQQESDQQETSQQETNQSPQSDDEPGPLDPDTGRPRRFAYRPGLVVVDGGAPQVAAAREAMDAVGAVDIPVVGLAKRLEEVWPDSGDEPIILARSSEGLYLLQRVRDEAHRVAIRLHRKRRSARMTGSALDDIPGLGPARRAGVLAEIGTVRQ